MPLNSPKNCSFRNQVRRFAAMGALAFATAAWGAANLGAAEPRLQRLEPQGARRGSEATIVLHGARIGKSPQEAIFYRTGIEVQHLESAGDNKVKLKLALAEDCPLGIHGLRVRTSTGLSNLMTFHVGALKEIQEEEPNNLFDQPQQIPLGVVVNGLVKREDVDYFAVEASEGERISIEIEGLRLGRTFFDPAISVLDDRRFEVARSDDATLLRQDAFCSFVAERAGRYVIEVRETAYRGDDASTYRLHVGRFPRPTAVYPPGGTPGEEMAVAWIDETAELGRESVRLPETATNAHELFAQNEQGVSPSGIPVRVSPFPRVLEVEPNDARKQATEFQMPAACAGVIQEAGDRDFFRFTAKKDQVLEVRAVARELRSPLDPVLRVLDAEGKRVGSNDDNAGQPDSYVRFKAPKDGEYVLQVEDHLRSGGANYVYLLEAAEPTPAVDLRVEEQRRYESQTVVVPRGNRTAMVVVATRRDVAGPLVVEIPKLPSGVTAQALPLAADYNRVPVVFEAADDAPLAASLSPIEVKHEDPKWSFDGRFRQQTWLIRGRNNRPVWDHWARRLAVAATEAVPFAIRLVEPKSPLVQNGSKELRVVAEREEGFEGAIAIRPVYNPPGVSSNNSRRINKGESEAVIPITANGRAWAREWDVAVRGEANIDGRVVVSTQFVKLRVAEPYVALQFPTAAVEQGAELDYVVGVKQQTPFEGSAQVELLGLPPGVTADPQEIDAGSEKVAFRLKAAPDARTGVHKQLFCRVVVTENEEPVVHNIYRGQLRVDKPATTQQASVGQDGAGDES